jgi:uncharacterized protein (DUF2147 family)
MWLKRAVVVVIAGVACVTSSLAMAGDVTGVWLTGNGESEIDIQPCSDGLCGRIARILKSKEEGSPYDVNNPDQALRGRPLVGLAILNGLKQADNRDIWQGTVYNPQDGETYDVTLTLKDDRLEVEGCMAYILCDSQEWTRVPPSQ